MEAGRILSLGTTAQAYLAELSRTKALDIPRCERLSPFTNISNQYCSVANIKSTVILSRAAEIGRIIVKEPLKTKVGLL